LNVNRLRIVPKNDSDDAVLSVSPAAQSSFDVDNVKNTVRSKVWRSTSTATQTITGVWSANRTVSHFSMHKHLEHAANVRLQLFSDAGASVQVYDSTAVSATPYTASEPYVFSTGTNNPFLTNSPYWLWFSEQLARSFKVTLSGTPSQAYHQVSRLWLGRYMELDVGASYGLQLGIEDNSDANTTRGGSLRTNFGAYWRTLSFDLSDISPDEYATWMDIMTQAGRSRDVVVSVYPGDGTRQEALHTIAGKFRSLDALGFPQYGQITKKVVVREN
jgi:hypothetical protein